MVDVREILKSNTAKLTEINLRSRLTGRPQAIYLKGENTKLKEPTDQLDTAVKKYISGYRVLYFDGDNFRDDKWTKYIKWYLQQEGSDESPRIVVATKLEKEKDKFHDSWGSKAELTEGQARRLYLFTQTEEDLKKAAGEDEYRSCPLLDGLTDPKFVYIGCEFFKRTRAFNGVSHVLAIGGGRVARVEAELAMINDSGEAAANWTIFDPPGGANVLKQWVVDHAAIPEEGPVSRLKVGDYFDLEFLSAEDPQKLKAMQAKDLANLLNPYSGSSGFYVQKGCCFQCIDGIRVRYCSYKPTEAVRQYYQKHKQLASDTLALVQGYQGKERKMLSELESFLRSSGN